MTANELAKLLESQGILPAGLTLHSTADATVRWLPEWVAEHGFASDGRTYWMWVTSGQLVPTPTSDTDVIHHGPDQFVLDLPDGRYTVDIYDTATRAWISRESAAASPLVAGLPFRGAPLVVRIVPVTGAA